MGRRGKVPLPYFELDCHMDDKVKLIQAEFGLKGFAVVVKLYQRIYGGEFGYYCEWDNERSLLFALENGLNGDGKNLIDNIVAACIKRDIFSDTLYKKYQILTSHGIQEQYLKATAKREVVELKKEYLLISVPENRRNVAIYAISGGRNAISGVRNTQSRVEEIRQDKIRLYKDRERACNGNDMQHLEDFLTAYPKHSNRNLTEIAYADLVAGGLETEERLGACARNYADACRLRGTPAQYIKNAENFLRELVFEMYLPERYQPPAPAAAPKKQPLNRFNDFPQRDYSAQKLQQLEQDLLMG